MRVKYIVVLLLLTVWRSGATTLSGALSGDRLANGKGNDGHNRKFLRVQATESDFTRASDSPPRVIEERGFAVKAIGTIAKATNLKAKMKFWLARKVPPVKVYSKLKITGKDDKKYKAYSRYYFKYMTKYPSKQPPNLPAATMDAIMKAKMNTWLDKKLFPQQVFKELGLTGRGEGQENLKYLKEYMKMWGAKQARISQRASAKLGG